MFEQIKEQAERAVRELLEVSKLQPGDLLVIGCSSSEIMGERIGKGSSMEAAQAVYEGIAPVLEEKGILLAVQCCEHLNRALIVERSTAEKFGYEPVNVRPWAHAGGSFATTVWEHMEQPAAVEHVRAHAGMDIGDTLIGMHLREVAVPVRLSIRKIGAASLVCARTRPKFIGGERARYVNELK
ncbi:MAG: TIGR01440 family protein [Oscillospiraceae bacterium]|nr:TIGR01440 family protein [Oscillospiraceae bacterium]